MNELNINFLSMTSQEISELTGKTISHINKDIENMLTQLKDNEPNLVFMYKSVIYVQKLGSGKQDNTIYYLNKELIYTLIKGYSVKLKNAIIVRWQELEQATAPRTPVTYSQALKELVTKRTAITELEEKNRNLKTYTSTQIAEELQFTSENAFNQALHNMNILPLQIRVYQKNFTTWLIYATYVNMGLVELVDYNAHWTQKGRQFLLALFNNI